MRGTRWENFKSAFISVLIGILAAVGIPWATVAAQIIGGYITAQFTWVFLVALDEIQRQRDESMRSGRRYRYRE